MSPIFIIAMIIVWIVVSQAKKAARQGMTSGAKALGRKARVGARRRIDSYRESVRSGREDVEGRIEDAAGEFEGRVERAAEKLEDRWSRAEELLGNRIEEEAEPVTAEESWPDWTEPSLEDEVGTSPLTVPEELPPAPEPVSESLPESPPAPPPRTASEEARSAALASRAAAAAAAATAAAAASQALRGMNQPEPEPEPEAEPTPADRELADRELADRVEAELSTGVLEKDLFESGRPGFEIEERFREEFQGRRVHWSGRLDRAETNLGGEQVEIIVQEADDDPLGRPLRWTFQLPRADAEDLISKREIPLTIEGTLDACDPYLRRVSLADARRESR